MPRWQLSPVSPQSVGLAVPDQVVTNAELCRTLDSTPEWIEEKTGILQRRYLDAQDTVLDLAIEAAEKALAGAGVRACEVDVLVVASTTPDWALPSMGVSVADRLGVVSPRIAAFTQTACASSVYGIYTAACMLQEPGLETALLVCAERGSAACEPGDRTTRIFFGDAAGAMVLRRTDGAAGLLSYDLGNVHSHSLRQAAPWRVRQSTTTPGEPVPEHHFYYMEGKAVLREATTRLPKSIHEALSSAGVAVREVSGFALHQANAKLVREVGRILGVDPERVPVTADTLGNTASVSPLTSLWRLARDGRARRGDIVVMGAIGAGFLFGSLCFRLPNDVAAAGNDWTEPHRPTL